ncbi:MAG: hypothetical protein LBE08_11345 [Bifidobacteriaceae bacterium]|jgi:hypothetical protein|nr:hypothetical protein [Bifidobacteriaceae bacterium]
MSRTALVERTAHASALMRAKQLLVAAEAKTGAAAVGVRALELTEGRTIGGSNGTEQRQISPEELAQLVRPRLIPGAVAQVSGSMAAFWAVAAAALGPEDWTAIAALPEAGLLAAAEAGLVLSRTVVVPDLGTQPLRVLAGLVDAYGLVVAGKLALCAGDRRRLEARLRFTGGRLITAGRWAGASVTVQVDRANTPGLGENRGLAERPTLDCTVRFKGGFGERRN